MTCLGQVFYIIIFGLQFSESLAFFRSESKITLTRALFPRLKLFLTCLSADKPEDNFEKLILLGLLSNKILIVTDFCVFAFGHITKVLVSTIAAYKKDWLTSPLIYLFIFSIYLILTPKAIVHIHKSMTN